MKALIGLVIFTIFVMIYFLPTIVAYNRKHHNKDAIFATNLFLGWTFLGWIAAFIWASTSVKNVS